MRFGFFLHIPKHIFKIFPSLSESHSECRSGHVFLSKPNQVPESIDQTQQKLNWRTVYYIPHPGLPLAKKKKKTFSLQLFEKN